MEDLKQRTGIDRMQIAYKGSTPAVTALLRGEVSVLIVNMGNIADHAKAGTIRILAAAGAKRPAARPDLPTIAELGVPGFATGAWWGLFGPANLPPAVTDKIRTDVTHTLATPEARKLFATNTLEPVDKSPEQFAQLIRDDLAHWGALWSAQYEWFVHEKAALDAGLGREVVEALRHRKTPSFARDDEQLVYDVVSELQETRTLRQASFQRALAALGPDLLIELVSVIGFYTTAAMMINAFDAPVP